jgi:hypothetical protein
MCGSTRFGGLPAHYQDHTTTIGAPGFFWGGEAAGELLVVVWQSCQTTTHNAPAASVQRKNQRLLLQLYAPDDGRGGARNMLSHIQTSSNKLVKLLHLVSWIILIVWWCTALRTSKKFYINILRHLRDAVRRERPKRTENQQLVSPSRQCSSTSVTLG